jgi:hypothetical protein
MRRCSWYLPVSVKTWNAYIEEDGTSKALTLTVEDVLASSASVRVYAGATASRLVKWRMWMWACGHATGCSWARARTRTRTTGLGCVRNGEESGGLAGAPRDRSTYGWWFAGPGWMSPAAVATTLSPFVFPQTAWNNTAPFSSSLTKVASVLALASVERFVNPEAL